MDKMSIQIKRIIGTYLGNVLALKEGGESRSPVGTIIAFSWKRVYR